MHVYYRRWVLLCDHIKCIFVVNSVSTERKESILLNNLTCYTQTGYSSDKLLDVIKYRKGSDGLMDKVSATQPRDCGFKPHTGHDHDFWQASFFTKLK